MDRCRSVIRSVSAFSKPFFVVVTLAVALGLLGIAPSWSEDDRDTKPADGLPPASKMDNSASGSSAKDDKNHAGSSVEGRRPPIHGKPASKAETMPKSAVKAGEIPAPVDGLQAIAPQSSEEPTGEFEPVLHARSAQITTCMDKIVTLSGRVIDRPHKAVSSWVQAAPNDHVFQSIIGLTYPNKAAPNGAAIVLAAPLGASKCEGETVQIYPTTSSCTAVQATLIKNGRTLTTLQSLPLLETKDGNRNLLMPTAGGGCVIVSIGLR